MLKFALHAETPLNADALRSIASVGHADGDKFLRIFHPAFPLAVLNPISITEAEEFHSIQKSISTVGSDMDEVLASGLPWEVMPKLGIQDFQGVWSKTQTEVFFEKFRHRGHIVWASKTVMLSLYIYFFI